MRSPLIVAAAILIGSMIVACALWRKELSATANCTVVPSKSPTVWGDPETETTFSLMRIRRADGTVEEIRIGQGDYAQYEGFHPMQTSSGLIRVNLVKADQPVNDENLDHIFVTPPVEFRHQ